MAVLTVADRPSERAGAARDARLARVLAVVVDAFALGFILLVANNVYGVTQVTSGYLLPVAGGSASFTTATAIAWPWQWLIAFAYFTIPETMWGATPGKLWMRLKVVRADGAPLTASAVIVRNLVRSIDWLPAFYLLGGVSTLVTRSSQRLGDIAAGTTVVYRHRALESGATRTSSPRARTALLGLLLAAFFVTAGFDYFGRPQLTIAGLNNQHLLVTGSEVTGYTLGSPSWGLGTVSYPITFATRTAVCTGSISLTWAGTDWTEGDSQWICSS